MKTILLSLTILLGGISLAQDVVNIYSARHYDSDVMLYKLFTEETGIEVNLIEGDADELIERIKSEGVNSPADIFITTDAGRLWRAEEAGILASVSSEVLESAIPENLRHPEGKWFGLAKRARVIVYNKAYVDASELSTYEDLADEKWQGRICIRSSNNIYNQSLLASIVASDGPEAAEAWAQGLVDNLARTPQGGDTDQITAVAAGECDVAVVNHYYYARMLADAGPEDDDDPIDPNAQAVAEQVALFFPNQEDRGTHINISGAAVVNTAPHQENALKLLEFLVSPEAQEIFADQNFEYPVVESAPMSDVIKNFGDFKADDLNVALLGENNPEAVRIMDRVGWR
ncbi:MAG: Fe(3+) ABC transporter substrate-binding protein [Trueperaceae bacterium]|nr:Fe(3+) ABC transporter substrate-binding protein [Trueperaceae bacterium]